MTFIKGMLHTEKTKATQFKRKHSNYIRQGVYLAECGHEATYAAAKKCFTCGGRQSEISIICPSCGIAFNGAHRQQLCKICAPSKGWVVRFRKYGISKLQWDQLLMDQDGHCAICKEPPLCVDHDHITGKTRGLLCHRCNLFLSGIEEGLHQSALTYLVKYASDEN
jgi:hypothetical protein